MANQWIRLWTDLPNDPKWRTISRVSKQPISAVISVYIHMLVVAANTHGELDGWKDEDVASALDLDESDVEAIREAMQGRVLDGMVLSGWEKRQPKREELSDDGINKSTERVRRFRERQLTETHGNASKRTETHRNAPDTDTDTEYKNTVCSDAETNLVGEDVLDEQKTKPTHNHYPDDFETFYKSYPRTNGSKKNAFKAWKKARGKPDTTTLLAILEAQKRTDRWKRGVVPHPETWLNQARWEAAGDDEVVSVQEVVRPPEFDPRTIFGEGFKIEYETAAIKH